MDSEPLGMDLREVGALGPLVLVRDAWCPTHGRSRPEGLAFPFTADREVFLLFQMECPIRGCEHSIYLDAAATDTPLGQHLEPYVNEVEGIAYPAVRLRPLRPGSWHLGVTSEQRDRPSLAITRVSENKGPEHSPVPDGV